MCGNVCERDGDFSSLQIDTANETKTACSAPRRLPATHTHALSRALSHVSGKVVEFDCRNTIASKLSIIHNTSDASMMASFRGRKNKVV